MIGPSRLHRYTYGDYVALEQISPTKHEFLGGEIYAMVSGSEEHSALSAEILRLLGNAIGDRPCRAHTSDLRSCAKHTRGFVAPRRSKLGGRGGGLAIRRRDVQRVPLDPVDPPARCPACTARAT